MGAKNRNRIGFKETHQPSNLVHLWIAIDNGKVKLKHFNHVRIRRFKTKIAASALAIFSASFACASGVDSAKNPKFRDSTLEKFGDSKSLKK